MILSGKTVLWPEFARLATSNNRRKQLESVQAKIERAFSSQELPVFRMIIGEGAGLFREMDDFARLADVFPAILSQAYEGSEATPLGHERSYNEAKILEALRLSTTLQDFIGRFAPQTSAKPSKAKNPFFRRIIAADQPGGDSHLSMEQDRYEARIPYRCRQHLLKFMTGIGVGIPTVPLTERLRLRNTCQEIIGIPDLRQPSEVSLLDLPVRISIQGNPDGTGSVILMIIDTEVPTDRLSSLQDRVRELETLLGNV